MGRVKRGGGGGSGRSLDHTELAGVFYRWLSSASMAVYQRLSVFISGPKKTHTCALD
jgi:hypothetical protein